VRIRSPLPYTVCTLPCVALLLVTVLSACAAHGRSSTVSGSPPVVSSGATPTTRTLPGLEPEIARTEWTLLQFSLDGTDYPDMDGPSITLRMGTDGAKLSGSSGCNDYRGTYAAEGVALRIELTRSSLVACSVSVMARERAYLQALGSVAAYGSDYSELLLANADGRTILWFHGDPAPTPDTTPAPTATASTTASARRRAHMDPNAVLPGRAGLSARGQLPCHTLAERARRRHGGKRRLQLLQRDLCRQRRDAAPRAVEHHRDALLRIPHAAAV
jgi:heat shock protein HslJ